MNSKKYLLMYFLYVDESGDTGDKPNSSNYFILSGILIHHTYWQEAFLEVKAMRERLRLNFEIPSYAELHASEFLSKNDRYYRLTRSQRIRCALHVVGFLKMRPQIMVVRSVICKTRPTQDFYQLAWSELIQFVNQRIEQALTVGGCGTRGLFVICDDHRTTPRKGFLNLLNSIISPTNPIMEKPFGLDSRDCDFLQLADLVAYLCKQSVEPSSAFLDSHSRVIVRRNEELFQRKS
jgi:hypothetical protein